MKNEWITVSDLALELNISRSHAYYLVSCGHFRAARFGGAIRILKSSVSDYQDRQEDVFGLEHGVPDDKFSDDSADSDDY